MREIWPHFEFRKITIGCGIFLCFFVSAYNAKNLVEFALTCIVFCLLVFLSEFSNAKHKARIEALKDQIAVARLLQNVDHAD